MRTFNLQQGKPIITSLLDTDKYKFSMQQVNLHQYPDAHGRYRFKIRNKDIDLRPLVPALREQLSLIAELRFTDSELQYLSREKHLSQNYIDYLSDFRLDFSNLRINAGPDQIDIQAIGPMLKTSPWEIYVLSVVNELYYRMIAPEPDLDEGRRRLKAKIDLIREQGNLPGFSFTDFGTRRRFSKDWQHEVVRAMKQALPDNLIGTSNYHLARELDLMPIGTMAHEYLQAWQAFVHPLNAQKAALEAWIDEFRGDMSTALTDVIGMEAFCKDLDLYLAKLYDGYRHDSGCPIAWGEHLIQRLEELGIDPQTKSAVWSDGLDADLMLQLYQAFHDRINVSFGWGTNLTNDLGYEPLNIVMKLVECNQRPVAKLSDSPGKTMCEDADYVRWLTASYGRRDEFVV